MLVLPRSVVKGLYFGLFLAGSLLPVAVSHETARAAGKAAARSPVADSPAPSSPPLVSADSSVNTDGSSDENGAKSECPDGMLLVDGEACPDAEQTCLRWLDPPPYQNLRCGEYAEPTVCKGPRKHLRYCIDREEYTAKGDPLPLVGKSWLEAKALCEYRGARLCKEAEWEFACEGPELRPYPYGFRRDSQACNIDRTDLGGPAEKLTDHRAPRDAFPLCTSVFGVRHMTGNVDEWTEREGAVAPHRSVLRGGWWLPGRNRCRAATFGHDENYGGKQVGFRCCKDAP